MEEGTHPLPGSLNSTVEATRDAGGEATAVAGNVSEHEQCERIVQAARPPGREDDVPFVDIVFAPSDPNTVYAVTDGYLVYRSTNAGASRAHPPRSTVPRRRSGETVTRC